MTKSASRQVRVRAARTGKRDSEVIEEALRRRLGVDLRERLWARNDLAEVDATTLAELERALRYPNVNARIRVDEAAELLVLLRDAVFQLRIPSRHNVARPIPATTTCSDLQKPRAPFSSPTISTSSASGGDFPIRTPRAFLDALEGRSAE